VLIKEIQGAEIKADDHFSDYYGLLIISL